MSVLAAAWLATPLFGLALTPPAGVDASLALTIAPAALAAAAAQAPGGRRVAAAAAAEAEVEGAASEQEQELNRQLRRRASFIRIKRPLGIATWASMTMTMALGAIRYVNRFGGSWSDTPCTNDGAVFGTFGCTGGLAYLHLASALATSTLYYTTAVLGVTMPDPEHASEGDSAYARNLRLHKALAWVHFAGMIVQSVLGFVVSNAGFDIADEDQYDTARLLATIHLGISVVTYGAFSWAAAIETF